MNDKELQPLVQEYFNLLSEKDEEFLKALAHGDESLIKAFAGTENPFEITPSERAKIANKYVKVIMAGEKSG